MKIAVIGGGAMGSIYGGHLSQEHQVYLVDTNADVVNAVNENGLQVEESGGVSVYHPHAVTDTSGVGKVDLVILFVKALFSRAALSGNQGLIGDTTYVMTLQNGSGHEDILSEFVPLERIIIGTTEDNGAVLGMGKIRRGGQGRTNIGMLVEDQDGMLKQVKEAFDVCGFDTVIHENIQQLIWAKLFTNVSLSAVTGLLQCSMGYITCNSHAWNMTEQLIQEAVAVAKGLGLDFDQDEITAKVKAASENSPEGVTSICADLRAGRRTEVDTISGSVVRAAKKCGVPAPTHAFLVEMIHAMEERERL